MTVAGSRGAGPRIHCVTGATGFVGAALVLELMARTQDRVLCLVRKGESGESPDARLRAALLTAARGAGLEGLVGEIDRRCTVLPGDLVAANCGVALDGREKVNDFWHCAASLKFSEEDRDEIFQHNVQGTSNVVDLARSLDCDTFNYMSTAYVCGSREGRIIEGPAATVRVPNNCYEESKIEAEQIVADSGLPFRIIRPSIVIGYTSTLWTSSDSGFYGYIKKITQLQQLLVSQGRAEILRDLRVPGNPEARLNLVPVDLVARQAVLIAQSDSNARYFHICRGASPTLDEMQRHILPKLGLHGPWIARNPQLGAHPIYERLIEDGMTFYKSYLTGVKEFSVANTLSAIGESREPEPFSLQDLSRYALHFAREWSLLPRDQVSSRPARSYVYPQP
ncbi:MAG: SDR family oxidoreductase [Deltaproteobacteria bacterium]|nr:SDR family oxidoreductase [Deltaproteobacteria bacterium]